MPQDRLDLRAEQESRPWPVEQRLLSRTIAAQEEPSRALVPEREREHPVQPFGDPLAVLLVAVDHDLAVRVGPESMAALLEDAAPDPVIVDLAIEYEAVPLVLRAQRLVACDEV